LKNVQENKTTTHLVIQMTRIGNQTNKQRLKSANWVDLFLFI